MTTKLSVPRAILDPQIVAEQLEKITLGGGGHSSAVSGMCIMEAVSYIAGEQFSAYPECACPIITAFMITFNDSLPDNAARDRWVKPLIPALAGSRVFQADGMEDADVLVRRSLIAGDAALRCFIPLTLDIAAESFSHTTSLHWENDSAAKIATERAAWLRALPKQTSFEGLAVAARAALVVCDDLVVYGDLVAQDAFVDFVAFVTRADLTVLVDFTALADRAAPVIRTDLADFADRASLVARAAFIAQSVHTVPYAEAVSDLLDLATLASGGCRSSIADLAADTAHAEMGRADQINEARVAVVLEMLAVQSKVFATKSARKRKK